MMQCYDLASTPSLPNCAVMRTYSCRKSDYYHKILTIIMYFTHFLSGLQKL